MCSLPSLRFSYQTDLKLFKHKTLFVFDTINSAGGFLPSREIGHTEPPLWCSISSTGISGLANRLPILTEASQTGLNLHYLSVFYTSVSSILHTTFQSKLIQISLLSLSLPVLDIVSSSSIHVFIYLFSPTYLSIRISSSISFVIFILLPCPSRLKVPHKLKSQWQYQNLSITTYSMFFPSFFLLSFF